MALSSSALHYRRNKASRDKKKKYDTEFNKKPEQRKKRSVLSVLRRKKGLRGDKRDLSHKKDGTIRLAPRSANRGRYDSNGVNSNNKGPARKRRRTKYKA